MNIYISDIQENYSSGLKKYLSNFFVAKGFNVINQDLLLTPDLIISLGYDQIIELSSRYPNAKIIIIDFHMLGGINEGDVIIKYLSGANIKILSCFHNFKYLYENFGLSDRLEFINFAIDFEYKNSINFSKENLLEDTILIPGKHRRDYDLLFQSIAELESIGYFLKFRIIDGGLSLDSFEKLKTKYGVKSLIKHDQDMEFHKFISELNKYKLVLLPLKNERNICNGLTMFACLMHMGKTLVTNFNLTTSPFLENGENCLCSKSDGKEIAKMIKMLVDHPKLSEQISNRAYAYAIENFSFEKLANKIYGLI